MIATPTIIDRIVWAGLRPTLGLLRDLRLLLLSGAPNPSITLHALRGALAWQEPAMAHVLHDSLLLSWLSAAGQIARKIPFGTDGPPATPIQIPPWPRKPLSTIMWPQITKAVEDLGARRLLTQSQYNALDHDARRAAFTVARVGSISAIDQVRQAVAKDVTDGGTLPQFRREVAAALDKSTLSPSHIEALYRTHVGQAYAVGQQQVLAEPLVAGAFPYRLWSAVHDSRTEPSHRQMEEWGQSGSAVYRADDPMWQVLWPPCRWNCRCHVIPLSIADAAKHGSEEARRWLQSGHAPIQPEYARLPYPITPPPNWPTIPRIQAIAI